MGCYYNYFPNATVKERIRNCTMSFYDNGWNAAENRWNYQTDSDTGAALNTIGVHGFGYTDEAILQSYLICGNTTWLGRMKQDMVTMINDAGLVVNGLITHQTGAGDYDVDELWNVAARRTFNIFYNFNYGGFYRNTTFLTYATDQFMNASTAHTRNLLWQQVVDVRDFEDCLGQENKRLALVKWLQYVNQTNVAVNSLYDLYRYFGAANIGNLAFENAWTFKGVFDEDTGLLKPVASRAVNVTAYYGDGSSPITFLVNGTYVFGTGSTPLYFHFNTSSPRQYWLSDAEEPGTLYIFDTSLTAYTISFLDLAGVLASHPFVEVERYINGSLTIVEKRKVDLEDKIQASLKQGTKYTLTIRNGVSYVFGELLFTSDTTIVLTLKGIEFPKETLMIYKYVRVYATRAFGTPNGNITIFFQDTQGLTDYVHIYINYKNGTNIFYGKVIMGSATSFSYTYTSALNNTDYALTLTIEHERYGTYDWKQYFPRTHSTAPWGLDWLGTLPFATNIILPSILIIFAAGAFSQINAEIGGFMAVVVAAALTYLGWIPIPAGYLITAFCLAVFMALVYAKRKVAT